MPFTHTDKLPGDLIRSADWNEIGRETERLGGDKVDRAGDTILGPLAIRGEVGVGTPNAGAPLRVLKRQEDGTDLAHGAVILGTDASTSASLRLGYSGGYSWIQGRGRQNVALNPRGGDVGVGTEAPRSRLSVAGGLSVGANWAAGTAAPANSLVVEGNVGVGVAAPTSRLEVLGDVVAGGAPGARFVLHTRGAASGDYLHIAPDAGNGSWDWTKGLVLIRATGNVGVGTAAPAARLHVSGGDLRLDAGREIFFGDNGQIRSADDKHRILFRRGEDRLELREYGDIVLSSGAVNGVETARAVLKASGRLGVGVADPAAALEVVGAAAVNNGTNVANRGGHMASGSLTVGATNASFGGGTGWNPNTAGLLLETSANTEIAVHDSNHRVASLMYFEGDAANRITIGRDMGWGPISRVAVRGELEAGVLSGLAHDYTQAQFAMTGGGHVSWGGSGQRLKWTNRFIAIPVARPGATSSGYIDLYQPTTDIPAAQVYNGQARSATAAGVVLNAWEALYAVHTPGGAPGAVQWRVVHYETAFQAPSNWLLVAAANGDDNSVRLGTGMIVSAGRGVAAGNRPAREIVTAGNQVATAVVDWRDVPNMQLTFNSSSNPVLLLFKVGGVQITGVAAGRARFRMLLDGNQVAFTLHEFNNNGMELRDITLVHMGTVTPGAHTVNVQWHTESATLTCCWYGDTRTLLAVEL